MKKSNFLLILFILLISCSSLSDAKKVLKNEKVTTTDEFLVKKRNPLVIPPDFEEVPIPGSQPKKIINEEEKIKRILNAPKNENNSTSKSSSVENSILKRIRK
tara:strand:- start:704 stop:1012 length:309 start_codon:yes stop_codon:yes gene_type:complete